MKYVDLTATITGSAANPPHQCLWCAVREGRGIHIDAPACVLDEHNVVVITGPMCHAGQFLSLGLVLVAGMAYINEQWTSTGRWIAADRRLATQHFGLPEEAAGVFLIDDDLFDAARSWLTTRPTESIH